MNEFSRLQWFTLAAALANSAAVSFFPPFDYVSLQHGNVPTFAGFYWVLGHHDHLIINNTFLALEIFVILANAGIAWLLLSNRPPVTTRQQRWRRGVIWMVGVNLILILMFPPFENYSAITKAMIPTFDGFYFIFGDNLRRQIVTTILYLEITVLLINAGLILLFLKDGKKKALTPRELNQLAKSMREQRQ